MRLRDIAECVRIVAEHPILGPRYGKTIKDLAGAWRRLLDGERFASTALFEETEGKTVRTHGVGISVFVTDEFLREAKTPPFFWLAPEITRRVMNGEPPLLTEKEVSEANSSEGLNLIVWQIGVNPQDVKRHEAMVVGANAFVENHRGFQLKEMVVQGETPEHLAGILNFGALLFSQREGRYLDCRGQNIERIVGKPHIAGLSREEATLQRGSWLGSLFIYQQPQLGFSRSEQRLLLTALGGGSGTDEELSDALHVSLFAVKKAWRTIYARANDHLPALLPNQMSEEVPAQNRGREKKRRLLAYLREHPEELRPFSCKVLGRDAAARFPHQSS